MNTKEQAQQKFGSCLKKIMEEKELSMHQLAASAGMEYAHVQRIAAGKVNLSLSSIIALAEGLNMSPADLFRCF